MKKMFLITWKTKHIVQTEAENEAEAVEIATKLDLNKTSLKEEVDIEIEEV